METTEKIRVYWRDGNFNVCGHQDFSEIEDATDFVIENNQQSGYTYYIDDEVQLFARAGSSGG